MNALILLHPDDTVAVVTKPVSCKIKFLFCNHCIYNW
jgi:hypothetical protein